MFAENVIERFMKSDAGQKFTAKEAKEIQLKRSEHVRWIAELKIEQAKVLPPLREKATGQFKRVVDLEKKLRKAELECNAARQETMGRSNAFTNKIANHEQYLRETYSPLIDEFQKEMSGLYEQARNLKPDILSSEKFMDGSAKVETNLEAQRDCRTAINAAIDEAESLKMLATDDVPAELNKIRATVRKSTEGFL